MWIRVGTIELFTSLLELADWCSQARFDCVTIFQCISLHFKMTSSKIAGKDQSGPLTRNSRSKQAGTSEIRHESLHFPSLSIGSGCCVFQKVRLLPAIYLAIPDRKFTLKIKQNLSS